MPVSPATTRVRQSPRVFRMDEPLDTIIRVKRTDIRATAIGMIKIIGIAVAIIGIIIGTGILVSRCLFTISATRTMTIIHTTIAIPTMMIMRSTDSPKQYRPRLPNAAIIEDPLSE